MKRPAIFGVAAVFGLSLPTVAEADTIETVECSRVDAERAIAAIMAEPSLEDGQGKAAGRLIADLLTSGACQSVILPAVDPAALTEHPTGGVKIGLVARGERFVVGFDFLGRVF